MNQFGRFFSLLTGLASGCRVGYDALDVVTNAAGNTNSGGSSSAIGLGGTGATPTTGGTLAMGGSSVIGGTWGVGGASSGGASAGATRAEGGTTNGSSTTGGVDPGGTGGTATGGVASSGGPATGGTATGGVTSSGGAATGGTATGGRATGGVASTGGAVTGGAGTAGAGTGGAGGGACVATNNCTCSTFTGHSYRFCATASWFSIALTDCQSVGMSLVKVDDASENAWLTSEALARGLLSGSFSLVFLGGSQLAVAGEWLWTDGTLFWNGGAVSGQYSNWASPPSSSGQSNCLGLQLNGAWAARACNSGAVSYICESP